MAFGTESQTENEGGHTKEMDAASSANHDLKNRYYQLHASKLVLVAWFIVVFDHLFLFFGEGKLSGLGKGLLAGYFLVMILLLAVFMRFTTWAWKTQTVKKKVIQRMRWMQVLFCLPYWIGILIHSLFLNDWYVEGFLGPLRSIFIFVPFCLLIILWGNVILLRSYDESA